MKNENYATVALLVTSTYDEKRFEYLTEYQVSVDGVNAVLLDTSKPKQRTRYFPILLATQIMHRFSLTRNYHKNGVIYDNEVERALIDEAFHFEEVKSSYDALVATTKMQPMYIPFNVKRSRKPVYSSYMPSVLPTDSVREAEQMIDDNKARYSKAMQEWWKTLSEEEKLKEMDKDDQLYFHISELWDARIAAKDATEKNNNLNNN